jgi:hypothetical protein
VFRLYSEWSHVDWRQALQKEKIVKDL